MMPLPRGLLFLSLLLLAAPERASANDDVCEMCRRVVDTVERVMVLNTTDGVGRFQGMSNKLCPFVPKRLRKIVSEARTHMHTGAAALLHSPLSFYPLLLRF